MHANSSSAKKRKKEKESWRKIEKKEILEPGKRKEEFTHLAHIIKCMVSYTSVYAPCKDSEHKGENTRISEELATIPSRSQMWVTSNHVAYFVRECTRVAPSTYKFTAPKCESIVSTLVSETHAPHSLTHSKLAVHTLSTLSGELGREGKSLARACVH